MSQRGDAKEKIAEEYLSKAKSVDSFKRTIENLVERTMLKGTGYQNPTTMLEITKKMMLGD